LVIIFQKDSNNLTAAHELAHQWFGNSATALDYRDAWLSESWATLAEALWQEHLGGYKSYINEQNSKLDLYMKNIVKLEGVLPIYDFPRAYPASNYPTTIYYKGSIILGMLRYKIGDTLFDRAMTGFLKKYKYSNLNTATLQTFFEQITQTKLGQFFDQWIYGPGWPKLRVSLLYKGKQDDEYLGQTVKIFQNKTDGWGYQHGGFFFDLPLELTFHRKDGSKRDTVVWMNGDIKEIELNNELVIGWKLIKVLISDNDGADKYIV